MTEQEFYQYIKQENYKMIQQYRVDNAVILAAGFASRFAPLSYTTPKALLNVRGEVLIERQIRQLLEAGIPEIFVVTGYKSEMFAYLENKFGVHLIQNHEYQIRNNHSSIYAAREVLGNSYICSADNYFTVNPFEKYILRPYYSALYAEGETEEYCLTEDESGRITGVHIGGSNAWYMLGHVYWNRTFSKRFLEILESEYDFPQTRDLLWEKIYMKHLDELALYIRKYPDGVIYEFDSLDDLCKFDPAYEKVRESLLHT